jgi:hypothetical protein
MARHIGGRWPPIVWPLVTSCEPADTYRQLEALGAGFLVAGILPLLAVCALSRYPWSSWSQTPSTPPLGRRLPSSRGTNARGGRAARQGVGRAARWEGAVHGCGDGDDHRRESVSGVGIVSRSRRRVVKGSTTAPDGLAARGNGGRLGPGKHRGRARRVGRISASRSGTSRACLRETGLPGARHPSKGSSGLHLLRATDTTNGGAVGRDHAP